MQAAGGSLCQIKPGNHAVRLELLSENNEHCRPDIVVFTFDSSPVEPGTWSEVKALY